MYCSNNLIEYIQLQDFPQFWWKTEPGALYTVLIEDNEPELPVKIAHFLAINVPGIYISVLEIQSSFSIIWAFLEESKTGHGSIEIY